MTNQTREDLSDKYAQKCVDDMDLSVLMAAVKEHIEVSLTELTEEEMCNEIKEHYPELLTDVDHGEKCAYRNKGECDCYKATEDSD